MTERENLGAFFDGYANAYRDFYDKTDSRSFEYRNRQQRFLATFAELAPAKARVLEVGAGAGQTALEVARLGHDVVCCDVSPRMIEETQATFAKEGRAVDAYVGTADAVPLARGPFDIIFALGVVDYVSDVGAFMRSIVERLAPNGRVIISFTNGQTPTRWVEMPVKRTLAAGLHAMSGNSRMSDVAERSSVARSPHAARAFYAEAGLRTEELRFFSYGVRLGPVWWPPFAVVSRWEKPMRSSPLRSLGRGFLIIGQRA